MIVGGDQPPAAEPKWRWLKWPYVHWHDDGCPGGHRSRDGDACTHVRWVCNHCHDDPPAGHTCPSCDRSGPSEEP